VGNTLSLTLIFTLVIIGLSSSLSSSLYGHLTAAGVPSAAATAIARMPPVGALFAAFLGYNPMATLLPATVLGSLPAASQGLLLGKSFFPEMLAGPFMDGLRVAFSVSAILALAAAGASWMRGPRYIYGLDEADGAVALAPQATLRPSADPVTVGSASGDPKVAGSLTQDPKAAEPEAAPSEPGGAF
jgi:hypothetical protein